MKKFCFFLMTLLVLGTAIVSCEKALDIVPDEQGKITTRSDESSNLGDGGGTSSGGQLGDITVVDVEREVLKKVDINLRCSRPDGSYITSLSGHLFVTGVYKNKGVELVCRCQNITKDVKFNLIVNDQRKACIVRGFEIINIGFPSGQSLRLRIERAN